MSKRKCVLIGLIFVLSLPIFILLFSFWHVTSTPYDLYYQEGIDIVPQADVIIVPGGSVSINGPSLYVQHRLDTAIALYRSEKASKILLSGAMEDVGIYEGEIMFQYLLKFDIPSKDIYIDNYGYDTHTTLHRARQWLNNEKVLICTQEIYMDRTMYLAKYEGLDAIGVSSDMVVYTSQMTKNKTREFLACTKAIYDSLIHPNKATLDRYPIRKGDYIKE